MDYYFTIENNSVAEFKDRGSKFIAYAFPVVQLSQFKENLKELKKEHPKAVHHCFAYRMGIIGDNFRVSDDGEPAGTAGKQILGGIDQKKLTDTLVVVVRYFGGTLLGIPGLINAYKTATALTLQLTPVVQKQVEVTYSVQCNYTNVNEVMRVIKQYDCTVVSQDMQLFCVIKIGIPKRRQAEALTAFEQINIQVTPG